MRNQIKGAHFFLFFFICSSFGAAKDLEMRSTEDNVYMAFIWESLSHRLIVGIVTTDK